MKKIKVAILTAVAWAIAGVAWAGPPTASAMWWVSTSAGETWWWIIWYVSCHQGMMF